jgi:hypothetical protein
MAENYVMDNNFYIRLTRQRCANMPETAAFPQHGFVVKAVIDRTTAE